MDYVVGSIAALLSGNVTPNRPKHLKKAQTPIKHQLSPNVTPKSEFVEDRSIFLSPTMQKKKDIVKKSPKRIFQNPNLDVTNGEDIESSLISPMADKVKKHLKDDLETDALVASTSLGQKLPKNNEKSPKKANKKRLSDITNEITPEKKWRISETGNDVNEAILSPGATDNSPKKKVKQSKPVAETNGTSAESKVFKKNKQTPKGYSVEQVNTSAKVNEEINTNNEIQSPKKKNKKRNKSKQNRNKNQIESTGNITIVSNEDAGTVDVKVSENNEINTDLASTVNQSSKKNKKKNKSKQNNKPSELTNNVSKIEVTNENGVSSEIKLSKDDKIDENTLTTNNQSPKKRNKKKNKSKQNQSNNQIDSTVNVNLDTVTKMEVDSHNEPDAENNKIDTNPSSENQSPKKKKKSKRNNKNEHIESNINENIDVNPNAVTNQDTDSEHDSDDEDIDSENEEINKKALDTGPADDSSDEEPDKEPKKAAKKPEQNSAGGETRNLEEETRRTLFVGNVLFNAKCKKEIKKLFKQYGQIESVRIRTVPVKDARDTPKLAVIKNELHPERTTVNVYVRFADAGSVKKAVAENNTILNGNHLRVQASDRTGAPHDTKCSIFVGNLPFALEDEALRAKFDKCGEIDSVRIVRDKKTSAGKGFGYVNFKSKDGVELALALTEEDLTIKNRIIRVKRCTQPTQNQLGKKEKFNKNKHGNNQVTGQFGRGKFGGRPNDRFGKRDNFRRQENQGNNVGKFRGRFGDGQADDKNSGAYRRVMNKRKSQDNGEGPPNKRQNVDQTHKEKKERKEFVGMTGEKKKKNKFNKGLKKKKILSEILTKQ